MKENQPTTFIIFGASGDLSKRYILPALENMDFLGEIVPISRKDYGNLKNLIPKDGGLSAQAGKIFHLAVPPEAVSDVVKIISDNFGKEKIKIMLEKPFGRDLESARILIEHIDKYFSEDQIYRIDHYLAKQSMERVIAEEWDKKGIEKIEIIASEKIDIEGRVNFYEQTGALKDFLQSHLLEMLAVLLSGSFDEVRRSHALKNLQIVCDLTKHECVKRGQYEGYRREVGNEESMTETFVSVNITSLDPLWRGVPIILSTGKAFSEKFTEIRINYKGGSKKVFRIEHEPDAYGRVIRAVLEGNHDLFISSGEILETWRILDAIQQTWKNSKDNLIIYKKGSSVDELINM
jgi:glucose-6-phosphate 1-dehydrogenase